MNVVINKSNKSPKNDISRREIKRRASENLSKGEINIFIPERNLSIDQVILQGEYDRFCRSLMNRSENISSSQRRGLLPARPDGNKHCSVPNVGSQ